jgi:hypothetical protein
MTQEVLDAPTISKVAVYNPIEAGLAELQARHGHVLIEPPDVSNPKGMKLAKEARGELKTLRTSIEKARVEEKAASLAYGRLVDSEAKRITDAVTPLELGYDTAIKAEEQRIEAILQQELETERARIAGHMSRIRAIKDVRETALLARDAARLATLIEGMPAHLDAPFDEFQGQAEQAFNEVCETLKQLHGVKVEAEAQAEQMRIQQAELAAQREEVDRIEAERQAAARAERERFESEQAATRAAQQAESYRIERERNELAASQRAEADRVAAAARKVADAKAEKERNAAKKKADAEALAERKRLDDVATARREQAEREDKERADKAQAEYDALMKAATDLKRLNDAAPAMLAALQNLENDANQIPETAWAMVCNAIELATGETA